MCKGARSAPSRCPASIGLRRGSDIAAAAGRAGALLFGSAGEQPSGPFDRFPVPQGPVLVSQQHGRPSGRSAAARARCSRISASSRTSARRHQLVEQGGQPLGVLDEIARLARRRAQVALVECWQVTARTSAGGRQLVVGWDPVWNPRVCDLSFGAGDPLRHRRFLHQERSGDLGRGHRRAHDPQGERGLRLPG